MMFSDLHVVADRTKAGNLNCNVPRLRRGTFCVVFLEQFKILPYHALVKLGTKASKDNLFVPRGRSAVVFLEQFEILPYHALVEPGTKASKDNLFVPRGSSAVVFLEGFRILTYHGSERRWYESPGTESLRTMLWWNLVRKQVKTSYSYQGDAPLWYFWSSLRFSRTTP